LNRFTFLETKGSPICNLSSFWGLLSPSPSGCFHRSRLAVGNMVAMDITNTIAAAGAVAAGSVDRRHAGYQLIE
jgi:hypothetical protein